MTSRLKVMGSDQSTSLIAVWDTVRQWPADVRRSLASQILASLSGETQVKGDAAEARPSDLIGAWRDVMLKRLLCLRTHEGEGGAVYLKHLDFPCDGMLPAIAKTVDLHNLVDNYFGPRLALDLNKDGRPLGLEILHPFRDIAGEGIEDDESGGEATS